METSETRSRSGAGRRVVSCYQYTAKLSDQWRLPQLQLLSCSDGALVHPQPRPRLTARTLQSLVHGTERGQCGLQDMIRADIIMTESGVAS